MDSNLGNPWTSVNGTWTDTAAGKQGTATGDAFYLGPTTATDFTYSGDVTINNGTAAALTFRASPDARTHYTVNVDANGMVKLWRPRQGHRGVPNHHHTREGPTA